MQMEITEFVYVQLDVRGRIRYQEYLNDDNKYAMLVYLADYPKREGETRRSEVEEDGYFKFRLMELFFIFGLKDKPEARGFFRGDLIHFTNPNQ